MPPYAPASLLAYLGRSRWYAGKGRPVELVGVTPLPWLSAPWLAEPDGPGPAVRLEVAELAYGGGVVERYQLAVCYRRTARPGAAEIGPAELAGEPVVACDALTDPEACRVLWRALLEQRRMAGDGVEVCARLAGDPDLPADLEPALLAGEQSNSSVRFGDVAILKLFRRLELGRNLDIEVHEALGRAGVADVARLYGWVEGCWTAADGTEQRADLAMAVQLLPQARDGWELALAASRTGADFTGPAGALGAALAETHQALRTAFPAATTTADEVADGMARRLAAAVAAAPALEPYAPGVQACFAALAGRRLEAQRVHGDFHLGQTLDTPAGWKIIDFEGEPAKGLAERAAPDSPWRDVAGMLRSFAYVGGAGAAAGASRPDRDGWVAACRDAFLAGYVPGGIGADDRALLRAYEADKAVYEVVYEVRNRPGWADIPLAAVAELADGAAPSTGGRPSVNPPNQQEKE